LDVNYEQTLFVTDFCNGGMDSSEACSAVTLYFPQVCQIYLYGIINI